MVSKQCLSTNIKYKSQNIIFKQLYYFIYNLLDELGLQRIFCRLYINHGK